MGAPAFGKGKVQGNFAKGWDNGKGKGGKEGKDKGPRDGHLKERMRITAEKFAGEVTAWKGKYGWITPSEAIEHEKGAKHNGGLFVSINDIGGLPALGVGDQVAFHIYEDDDALGAEEVDVTAPGAGGGKKGAVKGKSLDKGKAKGFGKAPDWSTGADWSTPSWGKAAAAAPWGKAAAAAPHGKSFGKTDGKSFGKNGKDKDNGKGKGKKPGHTLERTRITAEKFTGEVTKWGGKFGFVKPAEPIEHEKASKHDGCLFVGMNDIEGGTELTVGSLCEFHIYEDKSGLGAEEVVQY